MTQAQKKMVEQMMETYWQKMEALEAQEVLGHITKEECNDEMYKEYNIFSDTLWGLQRYGIIGDDGELAPLQRDAFQVYVDLHFKKLKKTYV